RLPSALLLARTPEELNASLDAFAGPSQNVVWASVDGSIGWRAAGLVPIRRPGTDGGVPYDGADPENDCRGIVPASEMPRATNPVEGFLVTANQRTIGRSFPWIVANDWPSPVRARRIRDLILKATHEGRKLDRD